MRLGYKRLANTLSRSELGDHESLVLSVSHTGDTRLWVRDRTRDSLPLSAALGLSLHIELVHCGKVNIDKVKSDLQRGGFLARHLDRLIDGYMMAKADPASRDHVAMGTVPNWDKEQGILNHAAYAALTMLQMAGANGWYNTK